MSAILIVSSLLAALLALFWKRRYDSRRLEVESLRAGYHRTLEDVTKFRAYWTSTIKQNIILGYEMANLGRRIHGQRVAIRKLKALLDEQENTRAAKRRAEKEK